MKTAISILIFLLISTLSLSSKSCSGAKATLNICDSSDTSCRVNEKDWVIRRFILHEEDYINDIPWDTKKILAERLKYPEPARKQNVEGSVLVTFLYNENGYIYVKTAISNSEELKKYVVETLKNIKLTQGIVDLKTEYMVRFDFKLL